jgi:predicted nucleotidyltransferase
MRAVDLPTLHCHRCIYTWHPIKSPVRMCPRCKSKLWDTPKFRSLQLGTGLGIDEILGPHRRDILRLARQLGARRIRVFGSVRRREAGASSDVDLLVDWKRGASPLAGTRLAVALVRLLKRPVDVAELANLPWSIRPHAEAEAIPL